MAVLSGLDDLPGETLLNVFKYLDGRDLVRCLRVCKTWKEYIDQSSATRYAIRLTKHGYKDGPRAQDDPYSSTALRLKALEDHINRWKSLDWIEEQIRLPGGSSGSAELVGGILAYSNLSTITCIELPSRIRQTPLRTWIHENDFKIISFTIDPSQDLLALVEILNSNGTLSLTVHLRTLCGNTPHPRASDIIHPTYIPKNQSRLLSDGEDYRFSVMGHFIVLLDNDEGTLLIWSWWTGTLICTEELRSDTTDFLWIGPRTILLRCYSNTKSVCDALVLYEIGQDASLRKIVALELPYSSYIPMGISFPHLAPLNQMRSGPVPFDSSEVRTIHIHLRDAGDFLYHNYLELLVSAAAIKHYMHIYLHGNDLGLTPSIPWTDWGPLNTRLISPSRRNDPFLCEIQGSRHVRIDHSNSLVVLDFTPNLAAVSPDSSQSQSSTLGSVCGTESNDRPEPSTDNYESPIHPEGTGLPYHEAKRKVGRAIARAEEIFVDDEHIVLFTTDDEDPVVIVLTL